MTKFDLGLPAQRFVAAANSLTVDDWTTVVMRGRDLGEKKRETIGAVENSMSAAERSALENRAVQSIGAEFGAALDALPLRVVGQAQTAYETAVFALQKRDKLAPEVLRTWFDPFELVGIRLDVLLGEDE